MYTIHTDVQYTAKLRNHTVMDENGQHVWHTRTLDDALFWLYDQGVTEAWLSGDVYTFKITFRHEPRAEEIERQKEHG